MARSSPDYACKAAGRLPVWITTRRGAAPCVVLHCARYPTLAAMRMRRYDFVAAYLQGELLEGETVYCFAPPGYERKGADGKDMPRP